ncbi:hypothetical protein GCM10009759_61480 [Kitasatospora saccharophila]|uniref:Uncharacterized protein n=1 Tax=Kitasatospora saccharophila TaxID=407973 RepID=A0ABN2XS59_9ACTN
MRALPAGADGSPGSPGRRQGQGQGPLPGRVSTLLTGVCPGPPQCGAVHTYLFVDGLDLITRSHVGAAGAPPGLLLRPGGPLWPTDRARTVNVAALGRDGSDAPEVEIRVRLRGRNVVWSGLMYPGVDGGAIEEVRFDLRQYAAELERGYACWGAGSI